MPSESVLPDLHWPRRAVITEVATAVAIAIGLVRLATAIQLSPHHLSIPILVGLVGIENRWTIILKITDIIFIGVDASTTDGPSQDRIA